MCTAASVLSVNRSALTSLTQHLLHHPKIIPDEGGWYKRMWPTEVRREICNCYKIVNYVQTTGLVLPFVLGIVGNSNRLSNANGNTNNHQCIKTHTLFVSTLFYNKEGTIRIKLCLKLYFPCAECSEISIVFEFLSLSFLLFFFLIK